MVSSAHKKITKEKALGWIAHAMITGPKYDRCFHVETYPIKLSKEFKEFFTSLGTAYTLMSLNYWCSALADAEAPRRGAMRQVPKNWRIEDHARSKQNGLSSAYSLSNGIVGYPTRGFGLHSAGREMELHLPQDLQTHRIP